MSQLNEIAKIQKELELRVLNQKHLALRVRMYFFTISVSLFLKRLLDVVLSVLGLIALTPAFVIISILIKLSSSGPIIFRQIRVGKNGKHFVFYKFRSMREDAEGVKSSLMEHNQSADGVIFKMKRDPRITAIGAFLRKSSLDETPQLFNVLLGDMSLVGPRPPLPDEVKLYSLEDRKRLNIIPGITCIWQISGRSDIPFNQQVELDKSYISSRSIWKDIAILLKTVPAVLFGRGAY